MGPLAGIKVVEMAGIGPGPFCAMLLADMGADVVRVDRTAETDLGLVVDRRRDVLRRGRRSVALDLKQPQAVAACLKLIGKADALVEGFRPGVMERLGLGPEPCFKQNPKLVYGRMTGWGQTGPLAAAAGHDINYIALSGALHAIGRQGQKPTPPLNLVGDFGGGALYLAFGIACALLEARRSGQGQIVDAAMTDGAASLMAMFYGLRDQGLWTDGRGENFLDGGAPWYDVYETKDGQHVAVGAIEGRFYRELVRLLGLEGEKLPGQYDRGRWPELRQHFAGAFLTKTRAEWQAAMEGTDACFAPVLSMAEVPKHPHNRARGAFIEVEGVAQPAPAPRFSRTPGEVQRPSPAPGQHSAEVLAEWGFSASEISALRAAKALG
jgi:alpha-methylacyl-CoA racemase